MLRVFFWHSRKINNVGIPFFFLDLLTLGNKESNFHTILRREQYLSPDWISQS